MRDRDPAELRREVGYVIQQVGPPPPPHRRGQRRHRAPRCSGWDKERTRARVRELLELIGLDPDEFSGRYPAQLSGGQQQRVGLARALAADPPVMLMDEPFSAVDPITRERLQNDFLRLHRAVPKTVVFVSHDIDEAVKMADRIAVMRDGRLVQFAAARRAPGQPGRRLRGRLRRRRPGPQEPLAHAPGGRRPRDRRRRWRSASRSTACASASPPGELIPIDEQVLVTDGAGRPLDWLAVARLDGAADVPIRPAGGAEPVLDQVTTLRDALSALLEANAAYGVVVDQTRSRRRAAGHRRGRLGLPPGPRRGLSRWRRASTGTGSPGTRTTSGS